MKRCLERTTNTGIRQRIIDMLAVELKNDDATPRSSTDPSSLHNDRLPTNNAIHLVLCVLGGLLAFLPLITDQHWSYQFDAMELQNFLELYRHSSVVAVTLLVPLALDTLLEFYYHNIRAPVDIKLPKDILSLAEGEVCVVGWFSHRSYFRFPRRRCHAWR